jgi:hypothetical protein
MDVGAPAQHPKKITRHTPIDSAQCAAIHNTAHTEHSYVYTHANKTRRSSSLVSFLSKHNQLKREWRGYE